MGAERRRCRRHGLGVAALLVATEVSVIPLASVTSLVPALRKGPTP
jgi:hypothetical protein